MSDIKAIVLKAATELLGDKHPSASTVGSPRTTSSAAPPRVTAASRCAS
ncbi:hypothetical protein ACWD4G_26340 [Streptomyces sp. NPDC002643]